MSETTDLRWQPITCLLLSCRSGRIYLSHHQPLRHPHRPCVSRSRPLRQDSHQQHITLLRHSRTRAGSFVLRTDDPPLSACTLALQRQANPLGPIHPLGPRRHYGPLSIRRGVVHLPSVQSSIWWDSYYSFLSSHRHRHYWQVRPTPSPPRGR